MGEGAKSNNHIDDQVSPQMDNIPSESTIDVLLDRKNISIKERQEQMNLIHPFGIKLWNPALYRNSCTQNAQGKVQRICNGENPEDDREQTPKPLIKDKSGHKIIFANLLWTVLFGFQMSLIYRCISLVFFVMGELDLKNYFKRLSEFMMWPFNKIIHVPMTGSIDENTEEPFLDGNHLLETCSDKYSIYNLFEASSLELPHHLHSEQILLFENNIKTSPYSDIQTQQHLSMRVDPDTILNTSIDTSNILSVVIYYIFVVGILLPLHLAIMAISWLCVFSIPIFKLNKLVFMNLLHHKNNVNVWDADINNNMNEVSHGSRFAHFSHALRFEYWKYSIRGVNIFILNMIPIVIYSITFGYLFGNNILKHSFFKNEAVLLPCSLISVVPLSYFIGMAVSSIGAQSSLGLGAVLNATFGSILEVSLYFIAISNGKTKLIEGSIIGSIVGSTLLLPGLSMIAGGIKMKQQRFNAKSITVSSTMLLMALMCMFTPTLFLQIFGKYRMICPHNVKAGESLRDCTIQREYLDSDSFYRDNIRPLVYCCSIILPLTYIVGLWFTLHTHVNQIYHEYNAQDRQTHPQKQNSLHNRNNADYLKDWNSRDIRMESPIEDGKVHPNLSKLKSGIILLVSTICFTMIAEYLVKSVDDIMKSFPIFTEKFLGLSLFALTPNFSEYINAIGFALYDNVELSLEIGSAYVLQVALLQIPALVAYSVYMNSKSSKDSPFLGFTLIFSEWDVLVVLLSVFLLTYTYNEGKSDYLKGFILLFSYIVFMTSFYLVPFSNV